MKCGLSCPSGCQRGATGETRQIGTVTVSVSGFLTRRRTAGRILAASSLERSARMNSRHWITSNIAVPAVDIMINSTCTTGRLRRQAPAAIPSSSSSVGCHAEPVPAAALVSGQSRVVTPRAVRSRINPREARPNPDSRALNQPGDLRHASRAVTLQRVFASPSRRRSLRETCCTSGMPSGANASMRSGSGADVSALDAFARLAQSHLAQSLWPMRSHSRTKEPNVAPSVATVLMHLPPSIETLAHPPISSRTAARALGWCGTGPTQSAAVVSRIRDGHCPLSRPRFVPREGGANPDMAMGKGGANMPRSSPWKFWPGKIRRRDR